MPGVALAPALALALVLGACASAGASIPDDGHHAPIPSGPVSIQQVTLAADHRSVRVDFVGGREFSATDPCSVAYRGTAQVVGDELEIGIYAEQNPATLPAGVGCDAVGHPRHLTLSLGEPYAGNVVHDLAGQTLFLGPPKGLAQIAGLPDGWELRRQENAGQSLTPSWLRVWSPEPDPRPANGSSMVTLIQSFGGPLHLDGGVSGTPVEINGQPATLSTYPPAGSITLVWSLGEDQLLLDGYLADFSQQQFVALAESVSLTGQAP